MLQLVTHKGTTYTYLNEVSLYIGYRHHSRLAKSLRAYDKKNGTTLFSARQATEAYLKELGFTKAALGKPLKLHGGYQYIVTAEDIDNMIEALPQKREGLEKVKAILEGQANPEEDVDLAKLVRSLRRSIKLLDLYLQKQGMDLLTADMATRKKKSRRAKKEVGHLYKAFEIGKPYGLSSLAVGSIARLLKIKDDPTCYVTGPAGAGYTQKGRDLIVDFLEQHQK